MTIVRRLGFREVLVISCKICGGNQLKYLFRFKFDYFKSKPNRLAMNDCVFLAKKYQQKRLICRIFMDLYFMSMSIRIYQMGAESSYRDYIRISH